MTKYDPIHETTEVDYDGVVAALKEFVGDYVHVHIEDVETLWAQSPLWPAYSAQARLRTRRKEDWKESLSSSEMCRGAIVAVQAISRYGASRSGSDYARTTVSRFGWDRWLS